MRKSNPGKLAVIALVVLNIFAWPAFPPVNDGSEDFIRKYNGENFHYKEFTFR